MKIAVSSVGTATSVGVIHNIRKYDPAIAIIGMDINPYGYTAGSQLVDRYYQVPLATDRMYIAVIKDIIERNAIDLFIPINDVEIAATSEKLSDISQLCRVLVPTVEVLNLIQHKYNMNQRAIDLGLRVPEMEQLDPDKKCIVRDYYGVGSKGIQIYESSRGLHIDRSKQFLQEYIDGVEYTVDVLSTDTGTPIYIIPRKRLEVKSGVATKVEIQNDPELIADTAKLLEHIKIPGFCNVQFIKDRKGVNWFIEINPRIGGCSNSSLLAAPQMFPTFMKVAAKEPITTERINPSEVKWGAIVTRYYEDILYAKSN